MKIRKAEKSQLEEIAAVWEDSLKTADFIFIKEDIEKIKHKMVKEYLPQMDDIYVYYSFFNEVVGFVAVSEKTIKILSVASWGQSGGLGTSLAEYAVKELGAENAEVLSEKKDAMAFYKHIGFKTKSESFVELCDKNFALTCMHYEN
jgi:putative acetyltransferase